jgi:hypothetical protein
MYCTLFLVAIIIAVGILHDIVYGGIKGPRSSPGVRANESRSVRGKASFLVEFCFFENVHAPSTIRATLFRYLFIADSRECVQ